MIYFKRKRTIRVKGCWGGVLIFTNMRPVIFFDMLLTSFANVARTTTRTSKFIYYKDFKSSGIWSLYEK